MLSLLSQRQTSSIACCARRRGTPVIAALPSSSHQNQTPSAHQDGTHAHTRGVEASAAATFAVPWLESLTARMPEAGIVRRQTSLVAKTSLKQKLMEMSSYHAFLTQLAAQPFLLDDWLDLTSRPFVQGHVEGLLSNKAFGTLLAADEQLRADVEAIVTNIDAALRKGHSLPWLVGVFAALSHFSGIYHILEVADRAVTNDAIARFERAQEAHIRTTSIAQIKREVRLIRQMLSPMVLDMVLSCASSVITPDRAVWMAAMVDEALTEKDVLTSLSMSSVSSMLGDSHDTQA